MKKKFILLLPLWLCVSLVFLFSEIGNGKDIPPCTCVPLNYFDGTGHQDINQDTSIVFDTCGIVDPSRDCDTIFWHKYFSGDRVEGFDRCMGKGYWTVYFPDSTINLPGYPFDTLIVVGWESMDTSKHEIRQVFQDIEQKYGQVYLRKIYPDDTIGHYSQMFYLYFDNWQKTHEIKREVEKARGVNCEFHNYPLILMSSIVDTNMINEFKISFQDNYKKLLIMPNGEQLICYTIYNMQGQSIIQENTLNSYDITEIDISTLYNGLYILKINKYITKFIIYR